MTVKPENKIVFSAGIDGEQAVSDSDIVASLSVWNPDLFAVGDITVSVYAANGRHIGTETARSVRMTMDDRKAAANKLAYKILDKDNFF